MDLKEAIKQVNLPYTTAARWCREGLVNAEGGGKQRVEWEIGPKEIGELKTLAHLRKAMSHQELCQAAETLRGMGCNPYSSGKFAVIGDGELIKITDEDDAISLLKKPGQQVLVFLGDDDKQ